MKRSQTFSPSIEIKLTLKIRTNKKRMSQPNLFLKSPGYKTEVIVIHKDPIARITISLKTSRIPSHLLLKGLTLTT